MRLIDADRLKAAIHTDFSEHFTLYHDTDQTALFDMVMDDIDEMPTAFDKEKVIEELVELRQREYNDSDEESETMDGEEIYDEGRSQGRFEAYHTAIEIVEKGGIE